MKLKYGRRHGPIYGRMYGSIWLAICLVGSAYAGRYEDGLAAAEASYYEVAHQLLGPLATEGHAGAAEAIRKMESNGHMNPDFPDGVLGPPRPAIEIATTINPLGPSLGSTSQPSNVPVAATPGVSKNETARKVRAAVARAEAAAEEQQLQRELEWIDQNNQRAEQLAELYNVRLARREREIRAQIEGQMRDRLESSFEQQISARLAAEMAGAVARAEKIGPQKRPHPQALVEPVLPMTPSNGLQPEWQETDYIAEYQSLLERASAGELNAARELGHLYSQGIGVARDVQQAAYWYRQAAQGGDVEAQFRIGMLHFNGGGVPLDYSTAYRWWSQAAAQGHHHAMSYLNILAGRISPAERRRAEFGVVAG